MAIPFLQIVKALLTSLRGPKVAAPMAPELPFVYNEGGAGAPFARVTAIPISEIKRARPTVDQNP